MPPTLLSCSRRHLRVLQQNRAQSRLFYLLRFITPLKISDIYYFILKTTYWKGENERCPLTLGARGLSRALISLILHASYQGHPTTVFCKYLFEQANIA